MSALARYLEQLERGPLDEDVQRALDVARWEYSRRSRNAARPVKSCPTCGDFLPASAFGESVARADGLRSMCKSCEALAARQRRG